MIEVAPALAAALATTFWIVPPLLSVMTCPLATATGNAATLRVVYAVPLASAVAKVVAAGAIPPEMFKLEPMSAPMVVADPKVIKLETVLLPPTLCKAPALLKPPPLSVKTPLRLRLAPPVNCRAERLATVKAVAPEFRFRLLEIRMAPALMVQAPVKELLSTPLAKASTPLSFF